MNIDPNRWTHKTTEAVQAAVEMARTHSNPEVSSVHLLLALLSQADGVVLPVLQRVGVAPAALKTRFDEALAKLPSTYGTNTEPQLAG